MSSQGSVAIIPFLGPWWAALMKSSRSQHRPGDRALGAAATLGLSIVIMRLVAQALKKVRCEGKEPSALQILQGVLKGLFPDKRSVEDTNDSKRVIHRGSCHCRAVTFELVASRTIVARQGPGKISYAHARIKAKNFRFVKGMEYLQMYYVSVPASSKYGVEPTMGAHTFCSKCGVYLLHAPNPDSNVLHVNVTCVEDASIIVIQTQKADLSTGVPVEHQWEEDDARDDFHERTSAWAWGNAQDIPDASVQSDVSSKGMASPQTPSTVETVGTDSMTSMMRWRSLVLDHNDSAASLGSESSEPSLKILPPLNTSLSRNLETPASVTTPTTTPMMRDQLKYYMRKHLPAPPMPLEQTTTPVNET